MIERVVDWIVGWLIAGRVSGWNTKLGAAATILLSISGIILVIAQSLMLAKAGHYGAAAFNLNSDEMWLALGGLGITKQMLGNRVALDRLATGELKGPAIEASLNIPETKIEAEKRA